MELTLKHFGRTTNGASKIIEITIGSCGNKIVENITNLKNKVDENLITTLRDIADELEEQNKLIEELENNK